MFKHWTAADEDGSSMEPPEVVGANAVHLLTVSGTA